MSEGLSRIAPTPSRNAEEEAEGATPSEEVLPAVVTEILTKEGMSGPQAAQISREITVEMQRLHIGPLPTVEDFKGYDKACPGAARDILNMAIRAQKHAHWIEKVGVIAGVVLPIIGVIAAVAVIGL